MRLGALGAPLPSFHEGWGSPDEQASRWVRLTHTRNAKLGIDKDSFHPRLDFHPTLASMSITLVDHKLKHRQRLLDGERLVGACRCPIRSSRERLYARSQD
jgi:hypothetical protein